MQSRKWFVPQFSNRCDRLLPSFSFEENPINDLKFQSSLSRVHPGYEEPFPAILVFFGTILQPHKDIWGAIKYFSENIINNPIQFLITKCSIFSAPS